MHKKSHLYHTVPSFLVVLFSYVSLSLHVHFPSNTDKSQGNRVEQVPPNCAIAACPPVSLNNSPAQGLQPTTFSDGSAVAVNSQPLLQTPHQAGHATFPPLISDLLRVHLPSYLGINQPSFPPQCLLLEKKFILMMISRHPNLVISFPFHPQEFEFLFILYDHKRAGSVSFSPGSHSQGTSD